MTLFNYKKFLGRKYGQYTIEKVVGEGRYAVCFQAQSEAGKQVLIKKFKPWIFAKNSKKNAYEAVILSQFQDDRIPELLGVINQDSFYGFILEIKPGETAKNMIFKYKHKFTEKEFYNIGIKLISIIKHLHQNGVVHRDIRLDNILIDGDNIYLIDFGLARFADNNRYKYNMDFSYLGDFLLYLLYSSFQKEQGAKSKPWYFELDLADRQRDFLKRLMGLEEVYNSISEIEIDFKIAFEA